MSAGKRSTSTSPLKGQAMLLLSTIALIATLAYSAAALRRDGCLLITGYGA